MQKSGKSVIAIKGAREHNLKGIDLELSRDQLTVITGVSGSGKSSLIFDTLYAEGYRKYMDSLSTRARLLMEQLPRPDVDFIEGLSPVIAVEQRTGGGGNPRSTVASVTEIADYARLLWSVKAQAHCPKDGGLIKMNSLDDIIDRIFNESEGSRLILCTSYICAKPSVIRGEIPLLIQRGFQRVRINGEIKEIDDEDLLPRGRDEIQLDIIIDRLVLRKDQRSRFADSLELAFKEGEDKAIALIQESKESDWREVALAQNLSCEKCGEVYPRLTPRHFSWDHPKGACLTCNGLGLTRQFTPELLVPDPSKSIKKGAIKALRLGSKKMIIKANALMKQFAEQYPFDPNTPWEDLDEMTQDAIIHGTGDRLFEFKLRSGKSKPKSMPFRGVLAELDDIQKSTSSDGLRARLTAYQFDRTCESCHGERLNAYSRSAKLNEISFTDFMKMNLADAQRFADSLSVDDFEDLVRGLRSRLKFLNQVGLDYLSLDRSYDSLSGGESQRVRLATQIGMGLVGVTYVLDEPTVGLHPVDTEHLIKSLEEMRDRGNTILVVEHDSDVMKAADHLIEIGPGAGEAGGQLIFNGTYSSALSDKKCETGKFLSGKLNVISNAPIKESSNSFIEIKGAYENNLKKINVSIPCNLLTVVTGVSGSGKSTLINRILGSAAAFKLNRAKEIPGKHKRIDGLEEFDRVVRVDQSPIGRSPRSNPVTFTKIFDDLRKLFAQAPLAKVRGYTASRFSFNVKGGRCERCQGDGQIKLDMQFMNDIYTACPSCSGKRYNRETLEIRFKGFNIADVLNMTVDEAVDLFANQPKLLQKLETLQAVGLGYLGLGQAAPTLSGGEAQRLKLSLELSKGQKGQTLYILDEPTTGLHWVDIQHLMDLLFRLRDQGHTLVLIEHNIDVIRLADWIIDLGPEGGEKGGELIFSGRVSDLKKCSKSKTARFL